MVISVMRFDHCIIPGLELGNVENKVPSNPLLKTGTVDGHGRVLELTYKPTKLSST